MRTRAGSSSSRAPGKNMRPGAREKRNRIMTRNILSRIVLVTIAAAVSLNADPTPSADRTSNKVESQKPPAKTKVVPKIVPTPPSAEGWSYVKGEWIHVDGYRYERGQVIRTG